jgi:hypothetical protein
LCCAELLFYLAMAENPRVIFKAMQLTFLGNTYTKSCTPQVKPDVQLRYQGKVYQVRRLEAANALATNAIVLTYRGVSYTK